MGDRIAAMGLRAPFIPLPASRELGLVDGQMAFPSTAELERGTAFAWVWKWIFELFNGDTWISRLLAGDDQGFAEKYPELAKYVLSGPLGYTGQVGLLYLFASDVMLEQPGLDPRKIKLAPGHTVVWYGLNDGD